MCVKQLLAIGCVIAVVASTSDASEGADFATNGFQILTKVVRQYLHDQGEDLKIGEGVHLVSSGSLGGNARAYSSDGSVIDMLENYLKSHEIKIKLPELMPKEGIGRALKNAMEGFESNEIGEYEIGALVVISGARE